MTPGQVQIEPNAFKKVNLQNIKIIIKIFENKNITVNLHNKFKVFIQWGKFVEVGS